MAEWNRDKVNSSDLNNGNEYDKDSQVALQELNGMVNAGLYAQDFAEHLADTPDISEINGMGTASVSFVDNPSATTNKPYKRFKFSNLKGSKGDKGDKGDTGAGSNPNLLINGDFRVNQRGETSYSNFANKYCVDRWLTRGGAVTVTPMDYGCSVSVGGTGQNYSVLEQIIEDYAPLIGKTVTLSANIKSVSVNLQSYQYYIRIRCYDTNNEIIGSSESWITTAGNYSCTLTIPSNTVKVTCTLYRNAVVNCTFEIEYMKLEIGSVATPFNPRPYVEELALCQRYYLKYSPSNNYSLIALGYVYEPTILIYGVTLPVVMRTVPTLQRSGNLYIRSHSFTKVIYPTDDILFSVQGMCNNMLQMQINTSSFTFNSGEMLILRVNETSAYISFDAEIY